MSTRLALCRSPNPPAAFAREARFGEPRRSLRRRREGGRYRKTVLAVLIALAGIPLQAQAPDATETRPSFTLATSHVFSSRERPAIALTYVRLDRLDFRVYRVNDAFTFFERLRDPHQLGSETPVVPQEQTWLERIAAWKAARRADVRGFARRQLSSEYRRARREQRDKEQVVLRRTVNVNTFAQVPVLNASQLVTSWRELLPPVRDPEFRRIPLDIASPGIYVVEAVNAPLKAYTVVVVSDVGLVTKTAPGQFLLFAANRFSGDPLPGCRVRVIADRKAVASGTTAADGTFTSDVTVSDPDHLVTLAECNGQVAATDPGAYTIKETPRSLLGHIYSDRPVYRPGHVVHFKGVLRWRERDALVLPARDPVEVSIVDDKDRVLVRERKPVDEFGAVKGDFTIPEAASLGSYTIQAAVGDATAIGSFEVQEYRKPEFDVAVAPRSRIEVQGSAIAATITAKYYFGQPVAGASVKYVVHRQPYYSPLRYDDSAGEGGGGDFGYGGDQQIEGNARLNDQGVAEVSIPLDLDDRGQDYTARIEARVTDASGREVAGAASVTATYGRYLVIARPERYVYSPADTAAVNLRAIDYSGNAQAGVRLRVALERVEYRDDTRTTTTLQSGETETDPDGRARWSVQVPREPGAYEIRVTGPSDGREVSDTAFVWVPGRTDRFADDSDQFLELVADRRTYQPGDTARLIVRGMEFDASVLMTKEGQHISFHQVVRARGNDALDLPITSDDVGDIYVSIVFLKDDRLYRAERRLTVPALQHQLAVTAVADKPVIRPGEPGVFALKVTDPNGAPVRAQLSVGLVDEALYGVRPDTTPDPLRFFYRREYASVATSFSRDYPFVGYSGTEQLLLARRRRPFTLADFKADRPDRPRVRKDFPDTVLWVADVLTRQDGTAEVKVEYPDSLTSWRLTVRAVTVSTDVGVATTRTTTTKDLILRVVTPRFLTEGDQVNVATIVHNYLPNPKSVSVTFTADGLTSADSAPTGGAARSLDVASNGQQRRDWRFKADRPGPVTVTGKATTDAAGDAMQLSLPVLPAGLQRTFGVSGSILAAEERTIDLTVPPTSNPAGRSIRVALAPSLAGTLLGALDYLTSYPWGCTEQTLSSFVPNLVVLRALEQMKLSPTERLRSLDRQVDDGLRRLYDYQHEDGGWGWWKTDQNHPFMTAYALDGLIQARDSGVRVEPWRIQQAARALGQLYEQYSRALPDLKAYELYVLARAGAESFDVAAPLDELWSSRSRMTASGQAFLLMTLDARKDGRADELARSLVAEARTRGDLAWWDVTADPLLDDIVDTSVEATALAIQALAGRDPKHVLLEPAARWLVANRTAGAYWVSTKQTALALRGLLAFMQARGEQAAPVTAEVFVNGTRIGRQLFDAASLAAPNPVLLQAPAIEGPNAVRIVKTGTGAIYYDASSRYYDKPAAAERTGTRRLALTRTYSVLSPAPRNGRIVYREGRFDGTVKIGDLILVRLVTAGSTDWRYLMLEDPIPAGTEPVEKEELYELERRRSWFWGTQRELRDDRVVFFLNDFGAGRYEFTYLLRVTTPGTFSAMPARISPMYVPDVSASSDVLSLTVASEGLK
jgi:uncharacterized protein YfaS (alpha-2-macroglobulin family)